MQAYTSMRVYTDAHSYMYGHTYTHRYRHTIRDGCIHIWTDKQKLFLGRSLTQADKSTEASAGTQTKMNPEIEILSETETL